jgi:hypothetical protein
MPGPGDSQAAEKKGQVVDFTAIAKTSTASSAVPTPLVIGTWATTIFNAANEILHATKATEPGQGAAHADGPPGRGSAL